VFVEDGVANRVVDAEFSLHPVEFSIDRHHLALCGL
jgi:hypothetical protein